MIIPGAFAVGAAWLATLLGLRWRWLRKEPMPAPRPGVVRRLPPFGSAARAQMVTLAAAERGMFSLLGVMERGELLPRSEIHEVTGAANRRPPRCRRPRGHRVDGEGDAGHPSSSRASLIPTINPFAAQLDHGVRQYHEMVNAAAQLVSTSSSPMSRQQYRNELVDATDRLLGWAQAFDELNGPRRLIG